MPYDKQADKKKAEEAYKALIERKVEAGVGSGVRGQKKPELTNEELVVVAQHEPDVVRGFLSDDSFSLGSDISDVLDSSDPEIRKDPRYAIGELVLDHIRFRAEEQVRDDARSRVIQMEDEEDERGGQGR